MNRTFLIIGGIAIVGVVSMLTTHSLARGQGGQCGWRGGSSGPGLSGFHGGGLEHGEKLMRLAFELDLTQAQRNQIRERSKSRMSQMVDVMWPLAEVENRKVANTAEDGKSASLIDPIGSMIDGMPEVPSN